MAKIRPIEKKDLDPVAKLVTSSYRALRKRNGTIAVKALKKTIFQNPWEDGSIDSLVCEDIDGNIIGFIGISPRTMNFKGEKINIAIIHNFAVKSSQTSGLVGIRLLKTLFERSYDLIIGNATSNNLKQVWESMNGTIGYAYSTDWNIPLQPITQQLGINNISIKWNSPFLFKILKPIFSAADYLLGKMVGPPFSYKKPEGYTKKITIDELLEIQNKFSNSYSLKPDYSPKSLRWVLDMAQHSFWLGELNYVGVYDSNDEIIGWFIAFLNSENGKVLQMFAQNGYEDLFIKHLLYFASNSGALCIKGRLEPSFMGTLSSRYCYFHSGVWLLLHGNNEDVITAITKADAFFSRLETEIWLFN